MSRKHFSLALLSTIASICLLSSGCGTGSETATISGTVVSNGSPIPEGRVVFTSEKATCAGEISDGKYQVKDKGDASVPLGEYTITVFPPSSKEVYNPDTGREEIIKPKADLKLFPKKYQRKDKSDIKFSPEAGDNSFDIVLEK